MNRVLFTTHQEPPLKSKFKSLLKPFFKPSTKAKRIVKAPEINGENIEYVSSQNFKYGNNVYDMSNYKITIKTENNTHYIVLSSTLDQTYIRFKDGGVFFILSYFYFLSDEKKIQLCISMSEKYTELFRQYGDSGMGDEISVIDGLTIKEVAYSVYVWSNLCSNRLPLVISINNLSKIIKPRSPLPEPLQKSYEIVNKNDTPILLQSNYIWLQWNPTQKSFFQLVDSEDHVMTLDSRKILYFIKNDCQYEIGELKLRHNNVKKFPFGTVDENMLKHILIISTFTQLDIRDLTEYPSETEFVVQDDESFGGRKKHSKTLKRKNLSHVRKHHSRKQCPN